jgi:nicotinamide-nucleotide amidase
MIAEILSTGDEIRTGTTVDTNSAYIAQMLEANGLKVKRHICVGDDMDDLVSALKEISPRSDIAVVTGGLGPTPDDLTTEAAAEAAGVGLFLDPMALTAIENLFRSRKRSMPPSNRKQAMFPRGGDSIPNPLGTAPGFQFKIRRCLFFFLPGVPSEMRRMLSAEVVPRILKTQGHTRAVSEVKTISCFGISEAETGERMEALSSEFPNIKIGLRAQFPVIQVKLYLHAEDKRGIEAQTGGITPRIVERLGKYVFSVTGKSMEAEVGDLLRQKQATIAVAESCTGGLISDWLTNVSGSSDYFLFSGTTYSNTAKTNILGVSEDTIAQFGAVHEETAKEMAQGARRVVGATYGLSTSGVAGPTGGTPDKPVGTVCIGLATPDTVKGGRHQFPYKDRLRNKKIFAMTALNMLRKELLK